MPWLHSSSGSVFSKRLQIYIFFTNKTTRNSLNFKKVLNKSVSTPLKISLPFGSGLSKRRKNIPLTHESGRPNLFMTADTFPKSLKISQKYRPGRKKKYRS